MKREITWQASTGQTIAVTVEAQFGLTLNGRRKTTGRKSVSLTVQVDGVAAQTHGGLQMVSGHPTAVARIGTIGLSEANCKLVRAAIDEVEASIAEHNDACDAHADMLEGVSDETTRIEREMAK